MHLIRLQGTLPFLELVGLLGVQHYYHSHIIAHLTHIRPRLLANIISYPPVLISVLAWCELGDRLHYRGVSHFINIKMHCGSGKDKELRPLSKVAKQKWDPFGLVKQKFGIGQDASGGPEARCQIGPQREPQLAGSLQYGAASAVEGGRGGRPICLNGIAWWTGTPLRGCPGLPCLTPINSREQNNRKLLSQLWFLHMPPTAACRDLSLINWPRHPICRAYSISLGAIVANVVIRLGLPGLRCESNLHLPSLD